MAYFIVQRVGSLALLYGRVTPAAISLCVWVGTLIKLGIAPLHFWVPPSASQLSDAGLCTFLTWQKVAPLSLLVHVSVGHHLITFINLCTGALIILMVSSLAHILVFSGLVQLAWVLTLQGGAGMWHYLGLYFLSLVAIITYIPHRSLAGAIALFNGAGLPPMTGFMIKVKALARIPAGTGAVLVAGRGVALVSYCRLALSSRPSCNGLPLPLVAIAIAGAV